MKISIQNLKQGLSNFSDRITPDFIDENYRKYYPRDFIINVSLDKIERDFRVRLHLKSVATFDCDRCLKGFDCDVDLQQEQIYKTGSANQLIDEDLLALPVDATEIDFTEVLNEIVILNHPLKSLCKEDCKGICPGCGTDLNENQCQCRNAVTDPRWDELRKLIK
jgi:uncharacterized protein